MMEARREEHSDSSSDSWASMREASSDAAADNAFASFTADSILELSSSSLLDLDWRMSFPTSADCSFFVRRAASRVWRSVTRSSAREAMRRAASSVAGDARRD